jgi:hypothetical protein
MHGDVEDSDTVAPEFKMAAFSGTDGSTIGQAGQKRCAGSPLTSRSCAASVDPSMFRLSMQGDVK